MTLSDRLDTRAAEDLEIAFRLVRRPESFHDEVVADLRDAADASHNQLISWAIAADRLMLARILLGNVDLLGWDRTRDVDGLRRPLPWTLQQIGPSPWPSDRLRDAGMTQPGKR